MQTNRLALGTVQFGMSYGISNTEGQVQQSAVNAMLSSAIEHGVKTIDTAIAYGNSEDVLGGFGMGAYDVVTKLPPIPDACTDVAEWVDQEFQQSLSRLKLKKIYGLLLHKPEDLLSSNGQALYQALCELRSMGLTKKIGISIYSPDQLDALCPQFLFDLVQAPFNIIDQRLLTSGWLNKLYNENIELHTRSTFLQGLMLMKPSDIPENFSLWQHMFDEWQEWLSINKVSALEACLQFVLSFSQVGKVVIGAENKQQLIDIINATNKLLAFQFPDISSDDPALINPANWNLKA